MSSPALNEKTWTRIGDTTSEGTMTMEGTINKSGILIMLTIFGAYLGWNVNSMGVMFLSLIINVVLSIVIIFKPPTASYLSQPYALIEGLLLGSISAVYAMRYPGIVTNTLFATVSCFMLMLALYRFRIIQVTEKFRTVIVVATGAIVLTYVADMVMGFFGSSVPMIHQATGVGIAFSVIVTGLAAFNLMLDFDMIEQAHVRQAPKYMEWYCGFALLLTLVWLYMEMLRLMSKLNRK
ncbi:MAG: Bax inhibitor-1/YccA family protein [Pseudobdellovibrio sp.]